MLNFLWIFMILAGIVYAAFTGNLPAVTDAALDAAQQAVTLCITMAGVLAFWVGLMRIAENAGMMQRAADRIYPLLHFLFPRIPRDMQHANPLQPTVSQIFRTGLGGDAGGAAGDGRSG